MTCAPSETLFQLQMLNRSRPYNHPPHPSASAYPTHLAPVTLPPLHPPPPPPPPPPHPPTCSSAPLAVVERVSKKSRFVPRGRRTSPNSTLPCPVCHQLYSRRDNLRTHMRIHSKEKPYSCVECHTRFRWLGALRSHEAMHRRRDHRIRDAQLTPPPHLHSSSESTSPASSYPYANMYAPQPKAEPFSTSIQSFTTQPVRAQPVAIVHGDVHLQHVYRSV